MGARIALDCVGSERQDPRWCRKSGFCLRGVCHDMSVAARLIHHQSGGGQGRCGMMPTRVHEQALAADGSMPSPLDELLSCGLHTSASPCSQHEAACLSQQCQRMTSHFSKALTD